MSSHKEQLQEEYKQHEQNSTQYQQEYRTAERKYKAAIKAQDDYQKEIRVKGKSEQDCIISFPDIEI